MADRGPNYAVERRRAELVIDEYRDTIERGHFRLTEIDRAKVRNTQRAELANAELDVEAERIRENEAALLPRITEAETNLAAMVAGQKGN